MKEHKTVLNHSCLWVVTVSNPLELPIFDQLSTGIPRLVHIRECIMLDARKIGYL